MNESIIKEDQLLKYKKLYGEKFVLDFISKYKKEDLEFGIYVPDTFVHIFECERILKLCEEIKFNPIKLVMLKLPVTDIDLIDKNYNIIVNTIKEKNVNDELLIKLILSSSTNCECFCKFITKLNIHLLKHNLNKIEQFYLENKKYLDQVIDNIDNENIDIFYQLNKFYNYEIKNKDEFLNIKKIRKEIFIEQINNCQDIQEIKEEIISCYFYIEINLFNQFIRDIRTISNQYYIPKILIQKLDFLFKINDIENKEELISFILKLDSCTSVISECEKLTKQYACKDISSALTVFSNMTNKIYLTGQPFKLLVHKIAGYTNSSLQQQLIDDISLWDKKYNETSGVSTSLINEDYMGIVRGDFPIIGFNNINPDLIVDMGVEDIYFTTISDERNYFSRYMTASNLIDNSNDLYNEIVLKRYNCHTSIKPDFTFSFDKVNNMDKEISKYFKIPNFILNVDCYAKLMNEQMQFLLLKGDIKNFIKVAYNLCISFCFKIEIMDLYLRSDQIYKYSNLLINMYLNNEIDGQDEVIKTELNYMLNRFKKIQMIQSIYGYFNTTYFNSQKILELKEKINKKNTKIKKKKIR